MFTILDHKRFTPSTQGLYGPNFYSLASGSFKCTQNPIPADYKRGIYKPRLTATRRIARGGYQLTLRIEFSVPKLIYGNNFDEVTDDDFETAVDILKDRLKEMGVMVRRDCLVNAPVSAVHPSKNIVLADRSTPYMILKELSKINLNQQLDLNQTDFRNEGHSLKYRANSFEVTFYDKLRDLERAKTSVKRAEDKDSKIQLNLFDRIKPKAPFEVLRMEVRLNSRAKIRQVLERCNIIAEPTFKALFSWHISQAILLEHWQQVESSYALLDYRPTGPDDYLTQILASNPEINLKKALQTLGLKTIVDAIGVREMRAIAAKRPKTDWYRLNREIKLLTLPQSRYSVITPVKEALQRFEPLKLKAYEEYNNATSSLQGKTL